MYEFIFCHGLCFDSSVWNPLIRYFKGNILHLIDLGYFNRPSILPDLSGKKLVGIGHSLGLIKLIDLELNFDHLIGINGFINFLGNDAKLRSNRSAGLRAFRRSFISDPIKIVKDFHDRCGVKINFSDINYELILSDLDLLKEKRNLNTKTFIFTSKDDLVVPLELAKDNFTDNNLVKLEINNFGKHGILQPKIIYEKIISFINDRES